MSCADSFRVICQGCLHDFTLNVEALKGPDRVEAVHQGRIALRRLRAALKLFKRIVEDADYQRFDNELRWISHVFGAGRDLDLFQEDAFEPAAAGEEIPGARKLADLAEVERNMAHDAIHAAVSSTRLRLLLVDLLAWLESGPWRQGQSGSRRRKDRALRQPGARKGIAQIPETLR